jgi:hypothetical protein
MHGRGAAQGRHINHQSSLFLPQHVSFNLASPISNAGVQTIWMIYRGPASCMHHVGVQKIYDVAATARDRLRDRPHGSTLVLYSANLVGFEYM